MPREPSAPAPAPEPSREVRPTVALSAVLALVLAVYSSTVSAPFAWDDHAIIGRDPALRTLAPTSHLTRAFWHPDPIHPAGGSYFRPLTTWSLALNQALAAARPGPFHLTNVAIHLAGCALVFALARAAGAGTSAASLGAALFGLAPRLTESVTWISGRTDLLAAAFALLALWLHCGPPDRFWRRAAAAVALLLALLSKEVAVAALAGLAAFEAACARGTPGGLRRAAVRLAPAAVAAAGYTALRLAAVHGVGLLPPRPTWLPRPFVPLQMLGHYAMMLLDPLRPRLRIGWLQAPEPWYVALGALALTAIIAAAAFAVRRGVRPITAAAFATAATALGMVVIVPLNLGVAAADRFLYLPLAGIAVGLAALLAQFRGWRGRAAFVVASAAVPAFSISTAARNADWGDEVRLWRKAVASASPLDFSARVELGNALSNAKRLEEAFPVFDQIAGAPEPYGNIGLENAAVVLADLGRIAEARERFARLVARQPERPLHWANLAAADLRLLRFDDAEGELRQAVRLFPTYVEAKTMLAALPVIRAEHAALPPESPDEQPAIRLRRANLWSRLGVPARATPLWIDVARAPTASPDQITRAAAYLASNGPATEAAAAVARLRALGAPAQVLSDLEAVVAGRADAARAGSTP